MIEAIVFSVWFFIPAGVGNVSPIIIKKIPGLSKLDAPLDGGATWNGKPLFGQNKTWRGLIGGTILGALAMMLQIYLYQHYAWAQNAAGPVDYSLWYMPILGLALAAGALLGDAIESMFKRQKGIPSGQKWIPFDQLDYIAGALLLSLFFVRLDIGYYMLMLVVWFGVHLLSSYVGYLTGFKDAPI